MNPSPKEIAGHTVIHGTVLDSTDKAIKFSVDSVGDEPWDGAQKIYWLPLSQVDSDFQSHVTGQDWVLITDWLAQRIGFI